jgi:hypothetical protein
MLLAFLKQNAVPRRPQKFCRAAEAGIHYVAALRSTSTTWAAERCKVRAAFGRPRDRQSPAMTDQNPSRHEKQSAPGAILDM